MKRKHSKVSSDVFLILTSLAMAFVVWMIAKESELEQQTLSVPVVVEGVPPHCTDVAIVNVQNTRGISAVEVTASAPKALGAQLRSRDFELHVPWDELELEPRPGVDDLAIWASRSIELDAESNLVAPDLPSSLVDRVRDGLRGLRIKPGRVLVQGRYVVRSVKPVFKTTGEPAKGRALVAAIAPADPKRKILVTAAPRVFAELGAEEPDTSVAIETEPISLSGKERTFTAEAKLRLPENVLLVPGQDQTFDVQVYIGKAQPTSDASQ